VSSKKEHLGGLLGRKRAEPVKKSTAQYEIIQGETTATQESVNTGIQDSGTEQKRAVKKATFDMDLELHKRLKMFAAQSGKSMVQVLEEALEKHLQAK
jgi:predicted HicB family RNase H-like nuclease